MRGKRTVRNKASMKINDTRDRSGVNGEEEAGFGWAAYFSFQQVKTDEAELHVPLQQRSLLAAL